MPSPTERPQIASGARIAQTPKEGDVQQVGSPRAEWARTYSLTPDRSMTLFLFKSNGVLLSSLGYPDEIIKRCFTCILTNPIELAEPLANELAAPARRKQFMSSCQGPDLS
jgi:hypothetical protein